MTRDDVALALTLLALVVLVAVGAFGLVGLVTHQWPWEPGFWATPVTPGARCYAVTR